MISDAEFDERFRLRLHKQQAGIVPCAACGGDVASSAVDGDPVYCRRCQPMNVEALCLF